MNAPNEQAAQVITTTADHAMTLATVLRHVELVEHVLQKVMKEGTHFGESFPGDKKKNLLKPGADKLCLAFQLSPTFDVQERQLAGDHREYRVTCRLLLPSGRVMGEGVGTCSTMESKYRWRNSARKCPDCGKETIIKGKEEYGGGWLCFARKGGCGSKWPDGAKVIESQDGGKIENPDIADVFNTCLKIGKKRAYVDATITATAASDLFTQDIEDLQASAGAEEKKEAERGEQRQETKPAATTAQPSQPAAKPAGQQQTITPAAAQKPAANATATGLRDASKEIAAANATSAANGPSDREKCTPIFHKLSPMIGKPAATAVWEARNTWVERFALLSKAHTACTEIVRIMPGDHGERIIADCLDYHGGLPDPKKPEAVEAMVDELHRISHGEVIKRDAAPT